MSEKYQSFKDLPPKVAEMLRKLIIKGEEAIHPKRLEGATDEEFIRALGETIRNPDYTEEELTEIVKSFIVFNNAVSRGLPNQLYQMFTKTLDTELIKEAYIKHAIWCAHHSIDVGKEVAQGLADKVKAEMDRRGQWDEEDFHKEYFLNREQYVTEQKEKPTEIELSWSYKTKEPMAGLVSDVYRRIGFLEVGNSRPQFKIYDLGHSSRGFESFPKAITLSGLEDCELDECDIEGDPKFDISGTIGLSAKISASSLLEQLHRVIKEYLNGDRNLHPEWYEKQLEALHDASRASTGIEIRLKMRAEAAERPQYELESYEVMEKENE